jgi:hypothetical protein
MRNKRRPYQRPDYYWQKAQRRGRRWRMSFRDWLLLALLGLAGLFAVFPDFGSHRVVGEDAGRPAALLERNGYYRNCHSARAAGAAPLNAGEPGYRDELDRDGDGVACEPYYGN